MSFYLLFKKELEDIFSNKRYVAGIFIQLLLLVLLVPAFSQYFVSSNIVMSVPSMEGFVPVGLVDNSIDASILEEKLAENKKLWIKHFDSFPDEELSRGEISAVLVVPPSYDEKKAEVLQLSLFIDNSNLKHASAYDAVAKSVKSASEVIKAERVKIFNASVSEPVRIKRELLRPVVVEKGGSKFSSFFLSYLIPVLLFFPVFMSGGLVVDSFVGEKERKTIELLLSSPLREGSIVAGKFLSISSFIALQFVLWLVLLRLQGIPIHNILLVFLILMAVNAAVISTAVAMGIYSKSAKEANISLMLLYVLVSVALIISLSMEYFGSYKFFEILPFISISRLVVGESVSAAALLFLIFYLSAYSVLLLTTSVKLLKRDDIVFGPRPSVFSLFTDFIESLRAKFEKNPLLGTSIVAGVSGAISVVISAVVEVSFGVVLLFFLGYSTFTVSLMIIFFALVEELLKPLFIFSLARKRPDLILRKSRGFFYGAASGISFFFFENIFFASMVFLTFPGLILQILTLRMGTTLVVHTLSSGFVGVGISSLVRGRRAVFIFLLALSTFIHSMYNFAVLGVLP